MVRRLAISAVLAISVISGAQIANSEDTAPTGNKGFTASKTTVVDLGPEIEGMAGRQLRMRVLTIESGYIGLHSHEDRPAVVYFMQGTDEVGFAVGSKRIMHPGDTSTATKDTTHYHRNIEMTMSSSLRLMCSILLPSKFQYRRNELRRADPGSYLYL